MDLTACKDVFTRNLFFPCFTLVLFLIITVRPISGGIPRSIILNGGHEITFSGRGNFSANYGPNFSQCVSKDKVEKTG